MIFSGLPFLFIFFPITILLYYLVPKKAKRFLLLVTSLIFYAWGEPIYILLMIASSLVSHFLTLYMDKTSSKAKRKLFITIIILVNLFSISFFKYSDFVVDNINSLFSLNLTRLNLGLPLGISFYTFQILSYAIDVYRKNIKAEKNFFMFVTYVSMFPQLISGPIVRYSSIEENLKNPKVTLEDFSNGFIRFIYGLGKKTLIANNIQMLFDTITTSMNISASMAWLGTFAFGLQIYFDFSGYTDMAIGIARMLGFEFPENFNYPYIADSVTDFWRRWHMSLSRFFRDYVYIPLGGNRCSKLKHIRNILIVWAITGLWHGSSWNFVLWGVYFGIILIIEKYFTIKYIENWPKFIRILYTDLLVLISWAIFTFNDFNQLKVWFKYMFCSSNLFSKQTLYLISNYIVVLIFAILLSTPLFKIVKQALIRKFENMKNGKYLKLFNITFTVLNLIFCMVILMLSVAYILNDSYSPFLYFKF